MTEQAAMGTFGGAISPEQCRKTREALGWTPAYLAMAASLAEKTILAFEGGVRSPRPGTLVAIRRAFRQART